MFGVLFFIFGTDPPYATMETIRLDEPYLMFVVSRYPTTIYLPLASDVHSLL